MLTGMPGGVKPHRMIVRFVRASCTDVGHLDPDGWALVTRAAEILGVDPSLLDHAIRNYETGRDVASPHWRCTTSPSVPMAAPIADQDLPPWRAATTALCSAWAVRRLTRAMSLSALSADSASSGCPGVAEASWCHPLSRAHALRPSCQTDLVVIPRG